MKTIWPISPVLVILIVLGCSITSLAQPRSEAVTENDMREYIASSKASGDRWGAGEERYVLENFNRRQLVQTIDNWQARNGTQLTKEVKITILVDYLLTELRGMRALSSVLDAASEGKSASFSKELKTQVASSAFREFQFAKIRIEVNVPRVDVEIDGKPFPDVQNGARFSVIAARPHVVIIRNGSNNCSNTLTLQAGRTEAVPCTFR
jgi:hypothetical protein